MLPGISILSSPLNINHLITINMNNNIISHRHLCPLRKNKYHCCFSKCFNLIVFHRVPEAPKRVKGDDIFKGDELELVGKLFINTSICFDAIIICFLLLLDHHIPVDVEQENEEYLKRSEELWEAMDNSFWWQPQEQTSIKNTEDELKNSK